VSRTSERIRVTALTATGDMTGPGRDGDLLTEAAVEEVGDRRRGDDRAAALRSEAVRERRAPRFSGQSFGTAVALIAPVRVIVARRTKSLAPSVNGSPKMTCADRSASCSPASASALSSARH
jgi:hypothetical protein